MGILEFVIKLVVSLAVASVFIYTHSKWHNTIDVLFNKQEKKETEDKNVNGDVE